MEQLLLSPLSFHQRSSCYVSSNNNVILAGNPLLLLIPQPELFWCWRVVSVMYVPNLIIIISPKLFESTIMPHHYLPSSSSLCNTSFFKLNKKKQEVKRVRRSLRIQGSCQPPYCTIFFCLNPYFILLL